MMDSDFVVVPEAPFTADILFAALVLFLVALCVKVLRNASDKTQSQALKRAPMLLALWIAFLSGLANTNYFTEFQAIPPRLGLVVVPPLVFLLFLSFSPSIKPFLDTLNLKMMAYVQSFRIFMEAILWILVSSHALPKTMSFTGNNFDILIGLTAPIVGFYTFKGGYRRLGLLKLWNITGILILSVTVLSGLLSAPTPFRMIYEPISTAIIATFPYILLPGFIVPFALACHILSLRAVSHATSVSSGTQLT